MEKALEKEKWWNGCAEILKEKNPKLFDLLSSNSFDDVQFCSTDKGEVNIRDTDYFHDQGGAADEAQAFFEQYSHVIHRSHVVLVYGCGLGYAYEAFRKWLWDFPIRKLIFLEDNPAVIKRLFETENGYRILDDKQVHLHYVDKLKGQGSDLMTLLISCYPLPFRHLNTILLASPKYREKRLEDFELIQGKVYGQQELFRQMTEWLRDNSMVIRNTFNNFYSVANAKNFQDLSQAFKGIPIIICGGGPSLDDQIETLKKLQNRAIIIGAGAGLNVLSHYNIKPHLACSLDPNMINFSRLLTQTAFEVPMISTSRVYRDVPQLIQSPFIYRGGQKDAYSGWFNKAMGSETEDPVGSGHSVTNVAARSAYYLAGNPIILLGVDMAHSGDRSYGHGVVNHPICEQSKEFNPFKQRAYKRGSEEGKQTTMQFMQEWNWYARFNQAIGDIKLVNCSAGGMEISDVESLTLEEAAKKYLTQEYDISGMVHAAITQASSFNLENIHFFFEEFREKMLDAKELCKKIADELKEHLDEKEITETARTLKSELNENPFFKDMLAPVINNYTTVLTSKQDIWGVPFDNSARYDSLLFLIDKCEMIEKNLDEVQKQRRKRHLRDWQLIPAAESLTQFDPSELKQEEPVNVEAVNDYYPSGSIKQIVHQHDGHLHGSAITFSTNGKILSRIHYHQGLKNGFALLYYPSGAIYAVEKYTQGKLNGNQYYFYESGASRSEIPYTDGVLNGTVLFFHPEGDLKRQMEFKNGKRQGFERLWDENTIMRYQMKWKDDHPCDLGRMWDSQGELLYEVHFGDGSHKPRVVHMEDRSEELKQIDQMRRGAGEIQEDMGRAVNEIAKLELTDQELKMFEEEREKIDEAIKQLKEITSRLKE